jgi:DNA polymerase I
MTFTVDFLDDGRVVEWETTADGAEPTVREGYTPRFYVAPRSPDTDVSLDGIKATFARHPEVVATERVERRPGFRRDPEPALAVDVTHIDRVRPLASRVHRAEDRPVGDLACFNVDFSRQFRYCLETDTDPMPRGDLSTLRLAVPASARGADPFGELTVDGTTVTDILDAVAAAVEATDPDVLVCSTADIVPTLYGMAEAGDRPDFSLSRWADLEYQQLASRSTYASYGRVGHSPARYNVPGRAIVDESNTFFHRETNLDGMVDLVGRSRKPLGELAWASIGNVLTAIQIRTAQARGVLVPWHSWRHEFFKPMGTLHDADRGGFIFAPEVGVHDDVHELDFASLYPNIICTRNVSPDVIRCDCHSDRADVPELDYAICDERGYLVDVLEPLVEARADIKDEIARERASDDPDAERLTALEGRSSALKWILVACFGYQGFSNAKFGRIECHEAINAFAREILVDAKTCLEAGGWRVVHGIVDSIWVTPDPDVSDDERESLSDIAATVSERVGIRLEYEAAYDWVAFVPQRDSQAGALTKYFGSLADDDGFKYRGIEARQRSTAPLVERVQRDCIERFDRTRSADAVLTRLRRAVSALRRGAVDPSELVERNRVSRSREAYTQYTRNVAALERAADRGIDVHPGQDVAYVVVDDEKSSRERVALAHEGIRGYDAAYYETQLVRAAESVLSPLGWDSADIEAALAETTATELDAFGPTR